MGEITCLNIITTHLREGEPVLGKEAFITHSSEEWRVFDHFLWL